MAQTVEVHRKRGVEAYKLAQTSITPPKSGIETDKQVNTRTLSLQIDPSCIHLANREHESSKNYRSMISGRSSELMVNSVDVLVKFDDSAHLRKSCNEERRVRPVYRRTRKIKWSDVFINGQRHVCAQCDCGLFLARKVCCRHIYHILQRLPQRLDFHPTCFKTYEIHFGTDEDYTAEVNHLLEQYRSYKGLLFPGAVADMCFPVTDKSLDDVAFLPKR